MSKPLAAFYGHKKVTQSQQPKPQEYTVLGINQPLIAPDQDSNSPLPLTQPTSMEGGRRGFLVSLLLDKFV